MSKPAEIPLSADDERFIHDTLADMSDPDLREAWNKRLRTTFTARAAKAVVNQQAFNDAFESALKAGIEDPAEYARGQVLFGVLQRRQDNRAKAIKASPQVRKNAAANRGAEALERASKTANPTRRRTLQEARQYVEIIGSAERDHQPITAGLVGAAIRKSLPGYRLPHWEKTTLPLKVLALSIETHRRGGRTINLRIGSAMSDKALGSSRGPASFMQNQVRETFRRRFEADAPEFWFVMERDQDKRFHLHGAYERPGHIGHEMIDRALRDSGGWDHVNSKGLSQVSAPLKDPLWWAHYTVKQLNLTRVITDRKLMASTAEIRDAARGAWDGVRSRMPKG